MIKWLKKWLGICDGGEICAPAQEPCIGCQQAMQRIYNGAHSTGCHMCGCHWLSKGAADEYSRRIDGHNAKSEPASRLFAKVGSTDGLCHKD